MLCGINYAALVVLNWSIINLKQGNFPQPIFLDNHATYLETENNQNK